MEEQILKMINEIGTKPISQTQNIIVYKDCKDVAEEITAHVFEFIEWLTAFNNGHSSRIGKGWRLFLTDNPIKEYSIEDVYQYWLENVKTK